MNPRPRLFVALVVATLTFVTSGEAQSRRRAPASYPQTGAPDPSEGARILEQSRNIGLAGPYFLEFELRVLPRSGAELRLLGRWFGDRNVTGPVTRVELTAPGASPETVIVQSGPDPVVWRSINAGPFAIVRGNDVVKPLAGTTISAADLQTPFMFWTEFAYEDLQRFRGRPTHVFLLYPPDAQADRYPGIGGVRVFIDTDFGAISQAQWVDPDGKPLKTITIVDVIKVSGQYIVKSFEVRDDITRDKTRFTVLGASLDFEVPGALLDPSGPVGRAALEVPRARIERVE